MGSAALRRRRRLIAALTLTALGPVALSLGGCGTPPWQEASSTTSPSTTAGSPRTPATVKATPTPSATAARSQTEVPNDLATGSAKRTLRAGGVKVKINYWSTLDLGDWTASATKPLSLSASATFIDGSEQDIFLSKASVSIAVAGAKGPLAAPAPLVDESSVVPGYLMTAPSSYLQVFTVPALAAGARSVTLTLTYELLAQSAPKSKTYSKQTASNELVIPIQP